MTEMSLEEFLKPLSEALGHDAVPDQPVGTYDPSRGLGREEYAKLTPEQLADLFVREGEAVGLACTQAAPDAVAAAIVAQAKAYGVQSAVYANDPRADACGLPEALAQAGIEAVRWDASAGRAAVDACAQADAGIYFPFAGIARTGTVAIRCDERCGRAVSLLPPSSIAVIYRSEIVPQMIDVLERVEKEGTLPSSLVFSTGPSATSDIELVRVVGVHGPVESAVIIVDD